MPQPRKETALERVFLDTYDFLWAIWAGRSSMVELCEMFSRGTVKAESTYRQIERIKRRAQKVGIRVEFDPDAMRFSAEPEPHLRWVERVQPVLERKKTRNEAFGFYAERIRLN